MQLSASHQNNNKVEQEQKEIKNKKSVSLAEQSRKEVGESSSASTSQDSRSSKVHLLDSSQEQDDSVLPVKDAEDSVEDAEDPDPVQKAEDKLDEIVHHRNQKDKLSAGNKQKQKKQMSAAVKKFPSLEEKTVNIAATAETKLWSLSNCRYCYSQQL